MRVALLLDGKLETVEVDPDAGRVLISGRSYPFRWVDPGGAKAELEIDGERVVVDGWPNGLEKPPTNSVAVNGELVSVEVRERAGGTGPISAPETNPESLPTVRTGPDTGDAIRPSMPGRVIEVRVRDGDQVEIGAVLLVLEAMKMRTEVTSPKKGVVRDVRVAAGQNVRSQEPMLRVAER